MCLCISVGGGRDLHLRGDRVQGVVCLRLDALPLGDSRLEVHLRPAGPRVLKGEQLGHHRVHLGEDGGCGCTDDLEAMNEREAEKFVKKDNVWKKPDYAAMLEEGIR